MTREMRLFNRADGVRNHFCVGRRISGDLGDVWQFWNRVQWASAGEVIAGRKKAESMLRKLKQRS